MTELKPDKSLPEQEKNILDFWQKNQIFAKVVNARENAEPFVFYDGPPFSTGLPHYGHIMQMVNKDAVLRYKTMRGYKVPRKIGWDTHGLPVEYELEKELGISGKRQIEEYGIEKFIHAARGIVLRYTKEWESTMTRMGRWMDLTHPYATMDNDYIESVWWAFSELYKKELVYKDYRVSPYCPRCGTVLSNFELNQGYKDNVPDVSIYVGIKLIDQPNLPDPKMAGAFLVVWTTTPWTLPANAAIAVNPEADYVLIDWENNKYIVAKDRVTLFPERFEPLAIEQEFKGQDLINLVYNPLYKSTNDPGAYRVVAGEHVTTNDGSGLVHIAPAYGEDDFVVGRKEGLPVIHTVGPDGVVKSGLVEESNSTQKAEFDTTPDEKISQKSPDRVGRSLPGEGKFIKQADADIITDLKTRGLVIRDEQIKHTYPFCWRCNTPLLYYPATSWFVKVSEMKDKLVDENKKIAWQPEHLRDGRFGKWLEGARDWAISRNRFWGAPLPIWECEKCHDVKVVGSRAELSVDSDFDLHRPYIDRVTLACSCGGERRRVPFVFDCWFESGSMPFAQHHYPFENSELFNPGNNVGYPTDFIAEALDQTRGWFYTLHVLGLALFGQRSYKSVVVTGLLLAPDGKKLSKSARNYTAPEILFDTVGVDPFRLFLFTAASLGEDYRISDNAVTDVKRRWLTPLMNVATYYQLSLAERDESVATKSAHALLDNWIKSRVSEAWKQVEFSMEGGDGRSPFNLVAAGRTFGPLIEDLSTWFVRLSRGRKDPQFTTVLREVILKITELYAPFFPFITESLYQEVRNESEEESVHLRLATLPSDWESKTVLEEMHHIRSIVSVGRELRAKAGIPNRQPLARLEIKEDKSRAVSNEGQSLIKNELQIEDISVADVLTESLLKTEDIALDTTLTPELKQKGNANLLRRTIQELRKQAHLTPGDKAVARISGTVDPSFLKEVQKQVPNTELELGTVSEEKGSQLEIDGLPLTLEIVPPQS